MPCCRSSSCWNFLPYPKLPRSFTCVDGVAALDESLDQGIEAQPRLPAGAVVDPDHRRHLPVRRRLPGLVEDARDLQAVERLEARHLPFDPAAGRRRFGGYGQPPRRARRGEIVDPDPGRQGAAAGEDGELRAVAGERHRCHIAHARKGRQSHGLQRRGVVELQAGAGVPADDRRDPLAVRRIDGVEHVPALADQVPGRAGGQVEARQAADVAALELAVDVAEDQQARALRAEAQRDADVEPLARLQGPVLAGLQVADADVADQIAVVSRHRRGNARRGRRRRGARSGSCCGRPASARSRRPRSGRDRTTATPGSRSRPAWSRRPRSSPGSGRSCRGRARRPCRPAPARRGGSRPRPGRCGRRTARPSGSSLPPGRDLSTIG